MLYCVYESFDYDATDGGRKNKAYKPDIVWGIGRTKTEAMRDALSGLKDENDAQDVLFTRKCTEECYDYVKQNGAYGYFKLDKGVVDVDKSTMKGHRTLVNVRKMF